MHNQKEQKGFATYRRLLQTSKKYWKLFIVGVLATMAVSVIDAIFAYLVKPMIDRGFIHRDISFIRWLPLFVIIIFVVRGIAGFISDYFVSRVSRGIVRDFRCQLFDHLLLLPARFYNQNKT